MELVRVVIRAADTSVREHMQGEDSEGANPPIAMTWVNNMKKERSFHPAHSPHSVEMKGEGM